MILESMDESAATGRAKDTVCRGRYPDEGRWMEDCVGAFWRADVRGRNERFDTVWSVESNSPLEEEDSKRLPVSDATGVEQV